MSAYPVKRGETLPLDIEKLAFGGRGVARVEGYTVFVEQGLPGQRVEATIVKRRKSHAEARIHRVLAPSPGETVPRCAHFGECGGCALQHYRYAAQIEAKREHVRDCLVRIGKLHDVEVLETIPSPERFEYRNKMEYTFSTRWLTREEIEAAEPGNDRFGLGLHVRRRFDRVVNVERCHLQSPEASAVLGLVRDFASASGLPPYSTRTHRGFWRFLVIREGTHTGERMVNCITAPVAPGSRERHLVDELGRLLAGRGPAITSLLHGTTASRASAAYCEEARVLAGEPVIRERLLGHTFEIGSGTFFQTNTRGAEALFGEALRMGAFRPDEVAWDLYCGVGAFSVPLAARVRSVVGVELVPEAVAAARRNAELNRVENAEFLSGDVRRVLASGDHPRPDVVVVDPPREGMHREVIEAVVGSSPSRIVYISCNPATLTRDMGLLVEGGYRPGAVRPVDMFPHTPHVECVTELHRGDRG